MRRNNSAPRALLGGGITTFMSPNACPWNAPRKILHVDMDAFYAAVEQRDRPEIRDKPVIVGGNPEGRGVVSTASYEARKFGIHSAMPAAQAKRLCPHAIFLRPDFEKYESVSRKIHSVLQKYTLKIEPAGLDEAYLDVTENLLRLEDPAELARLIKQHLKAATELTASAGVAPNKFLAKTASDTHKPDGLTVIRPGEVQEFLDSLPVRKMPGVGPVTEQKLSEMGTLTCRELRSRSLEELVRHFGKFGADLYEMARGVDESPVVVEYAPKQIGSEETFDRDIVDTAVLEGEIASLAEIVEARLKEEKISGRTVTLKVKYDDFTVITRSKTLDHAVRGADDIREEACRLLREKTEAGRRKIRLLGVSVSHFEGAQREPSQLELFPEASEPVDRNL